MENLITAFFDQNNDFRGLLENVRENYVEDWSQYVVVDGEEGDYGTVKYSTADGVHVATYTNEGGDVDYFDFTEAGKEIMKDQLREMLIVWIDAL